MIIEWIFKWNSVKKKRPSALQQAFHHFLKSGFIATDQIAGLVQLIRTNISKNFSCISLNFDHRRNRCNPISFPNYIQFQYIILAKRNCSSINPFPSQQWMWTGAIDWIPFISKFFKPREGCYNFGMVFRISENFYPVRKLFGFMSKWFIYIDRLVAGGKQLNELPRSRELRGSSFVLP